MLPIGLLVYWFICTIKQDILQITILYHVGSPVDEPPWVTAAAGSLAHGEIIYGGTRWIEDDCSATFSEYIFLFPACLMISHWLTKNAELNSVF